MVKQEKTIDGFPVRRAKDSTLVARSKANKLRSNNKVVNNRVRAVSQNDPLVRKAIQKSEVTNNRSQKVAPRKRAVSRRKTAEMFVAEPKAFNLDIETSKGEVELFDEDDDFVREIRDERLGEDAVSQAVANEEASEDFLAPVESFDLNTDDDTTDDGVLDEVDDDEVKSMKKKKKELKESEKKAILERKRIAKIEKTEKKKEKKQRKKHKVLKKILKWVLFIIIILVVGAGVYLYFWGDDIIKKITSGNGDIWSAISAVTSEKYDPLKEDEKGRTNILVFGTSGFDSEGTGFGGYAHDGSNLTDSIMVVSIDQDEGDVAIVSLPRDLYAGYTCTATSKINEVYWCANQYGEDEEAGANALQAKIREILGIDTQYWVHMNWGALVSIVDSVGGITVVLDEDINDYAFTGAVYQAGVPYTLNGEAALGLSRARHGTEYGDFSRAASQQKILIGIKDKVVEKGLGLSEAVNIISALGDNLRMNFNMSEIKTGMHLLETFDLDSIRQIPLWNDNAQYMRFGTQDGISYIVPMAGIGNYGALQEYIAKQLKSNPAEREGAVIIVYNGSGVDGLAADERSMLEEKGYVVREIANAPEGEYKYPEEVEIYDASEGTKPDSKRALEKLYGLEMKDMSTLPNDISPIGYDFIIILGGGELSEELE